MKARVKATGEIVEVSPYWTEIHTTNGGCYEMTEVDLIHEVPDYWDRLLHQYAGMAMRGMVKTYEQMMRADIECKMDCCEYVDAEVANGVLRSHAEACAEFCAEFATALVNKLKEEEK